MDVAGASLNAGTSGVPSRGEMKEGHARRRARAARRARGTTDEWNPKGRGYLNVARPGGIDRTEGREECPLGGRQNGPLAQLGGKYSHC